jgi:hypothetical protein
MELKSFVTQALVEIVEGVKDAQEKTQQTNALISPKDIFFTRPTDENKIAIQDMNGERRYGQMIEFDISVTASERDETQGGVGIQVASITIGAGLSGRTEDQNSIVSRLKFSVPVFLPEDSKHP